MDKKIMGGAFQIARQIFSSEIWRDKPATWKIIWIYILGKVNHKDDGKFKRGEGFFNFSQELKDIGYDITYDNIRHALQFLKSRSMVSTIKSTRGIIIKVLMYDKYQDFKNYQSTKESTILSTTKAQPKHNESTTINKNDKNDKNDKNSIGEASSPEVIPNLLNDKQKHIQIIGLFALKKNITFTSKEHQSSFIRRNLRPAKDLTPYEMDRITEVMDYLNATANYKWTIESIGKIIDENLNNLTARTSKIAIIN